MRPLLELLGVNTESVTGNILYFVNQTMVKHFLQHFNQRTSVLIIKLTE